MDRERALRERTVIPRCVAGGLLLAGMAAAADARAGEDGLEFGAAIRFSYGWLDYADSPGADLELLRGEARGRAGRASFSLQYRWYDGFDAVHHAWAGWDTGADSQLRAGVQQVPFGLLPYASHSFWFGSGYYLGIEDDYDLGIAWEHGAGAHRWHVAWFSGDEYGTGARFDRYSFDVATTDALPYRERGRVAVRYEYTTEWGGGEVALGVSAFGGQIENTVGGSRHRHDAAALHAQWQRGPGTVQLQWARYRYGNPGPRMAMSAFMFPFEIAAEADVPTLNVAWALPRPGWFDGVTCYNNLSLTLPAGNAPGLRESWQNVTGCSLAKGPMFTYVDWIAGKNMWFAGGAGIGIDEPGSSGWRSRLNINVGFFF